MFETIINLKPKAEWREGVTLDGLRAEMDKALQFPGISNAWTQPIRARIDMLATGIRTPIGVKVFGTDLAQMEAISRQVETVLKAVPGTSSAYAERVIGGYFLDIVPDRIALGRYGLSIGDVQNAVVMAMGGETVTTTVEGRERYGVSIRYPRDLRSDPQAIAREVQVSTPSGASVPLGEVASIERKRGATSIRTENGELAVYIFVDTVGRDLGGYVRDARNAIAQSVKLPAGYRIAWGTGSEVMQRIAVPMIGGMVSSTVLTLLVIPAIYGLVKGWRLPAAATDETASATARAAAVLG